MLDLNEDLFSRTQALEIVTEPNETLSRSLGLNIEVIELPKISIVECFKVNFDPFVTKYKKL
jgi:hypothetical protein